MSDSINMLLRSSFTRPVLKRDMALRSVVSSRVVSVSKEVVKIYKDDDIIPDFLTTYASICKAIPVEKCETVMVVPPVDEQMHIMDILDKLSRLADIEHVKGLLVHLLCTDNREAFEAVVNSLLAYNEAIDVIRSVYSSVIS